MKRLVSGIKPTGEIHLGNYFGAMKQFLDLQNDYESFLFIADYHALNQIHDPELLRHNILEIAKAYLAIGLDIDKVTLFRQSDINFHTELCWILNSFAPMSMLKRAHAYKDAEAKNEAVNMGLFDYPVLMAADILLYDADVVPVGNDQKQHVEITQELARMFNNNYGDVFKVPAELIKGESAVIKGLDGRKMSKSYKNTIGLFDTREELTKKVMSIVTDSKGANEPKDPDTCNVFYFHKLVSPNTSDLRRRYLEGTISYKESKEMLIEALDAFIAPIRNKKQELDKNEGYILEVLKEGQEKAYTRAQEKMMQVKKAIGVSF